MTLLNVCIENQQADVRYKYMQRLKIYKGANLHFFAIFSIFGTPVNFNLNVFQNSEGTFLKQLFTTFESPIQFYPKILLWR